MLIWQKRISQIFIKGIKDAEFMMISNLCKSGKNWKRFKNTILDISLTKELTENHALLGFKSLSKNPWNKKTRVYTWIAFWRTEKLG